MGGGEYGQSKESVEATGMTAEQESDIGFKGAGKKESLWCFSSVKGQRRMFAFSSQER